MHLIWRRWRAPSRRVSFPPATWWSAFALKAFPIWGMPRWIRRAACARACPRSFTAGGKTPEQIVGIIGAMRDAGQERILVTRLDEEKHRALTALGCELAYHAEARAAVAGELPEPDGNGEILIVTAGTSDAPVAAEAELTARFLGNHVTCVQDAGVAGIHRLLRHADKISRAQVIIAIAGMEGALSSVVAGLAACPVIAVPTSVGYGANLGGITALLAMVNSCASGLSVVNIDNGFGAAYQASLINHLPGRRV